LYWSSNGGWYVARDNELAGAQARAKRECEALYEKCTDSNLKGENNTFYCLAIAHASLDEKRLAASIQPSRRQARTGVLERCLTEFKSSCAIKAVLCNDD